ncbi:MAG: hypothetical protein ACI4T3_02725 [Lactobacillus sp.]|jgi:hypothetical protein
MDYKTKLKAEKQDSKQEGIEITVQNLLNYYHDQGIDLNTVKNTIRAAVPDLPQEEINELIKKYYK